MKLKILLLLIVASAICIVRSEPSKRSSSGGSGNPLGIIKAELIEEDASTAEGHDMVAAADQSGAESTQRIVIKPIKRHRGKRIRIRLVNKPKNYVRLKLAGTKNVEQKYPGDNEEEGGEEYESANDDEGYETKNTEYAEDNGEENASPTSSSSATEDTDNGEDPMKVKHHHHHHHHNHIKTVVKKVPEPYQVEKIVHVPVEKIVHVPVEKIVHIPVEKIVEKIITVPKPYPVEKIVHVPKIVEKIVYKDFKDFGKSHGGNSYSGTKSFSDLTHDSKLKFGASGSSLDIIYPNGHSSSFPSNENNNGLFNSYGQPLGKHTKYPDFEDISKPNNFHSILDNDAFDFGGLHTSKPKDHHHTNNNSNNGKKNKKNSNKNRNHKNHKNSKNKGPKGPLNNNIINHSHNTPNDDFYSSSSANSHSYSGISMPSYTHEFSVSNSDQKDVYFNPAGQSAGSSRPSHHQPQQQVHYESLPFRYPASSLHESDSEYIGTASTQNSDFSQYNWSPSVSDFGSTASAFNLPTSQFHQNGQSSNLAGAESAQVGPVFRPPRKNPPAPFHGGGGGKKGSSHGAPRAGPRRPPRNNQGESFLRGPAPPKSMAGHPYRPEGYGNSGGSGNLRGAASNQKGFVHHSRPRPLMAASATEQQIETVMMPPVKETFKGA